MAFQRNPARHALIAVFALALVGAANDESGRVELDQGIAALNAGHIDAARESLRAAGRLAPEKPEAHAYLAQVAIIRRDSPVALAEIDRAESLGYPASDLKHLRADAQQLAGDQDGALRTADPAEIPPRFSAYAARVRARVWMAVGNIPNASQELNLAQKLDPNAPDLWVTVAHFRLAQGNFAGGKEAGERAVKLGPNSPDALLLAANFVRDRYGFEPALPWYDRVITVDPGNRDALVERTATLADAGHNMAALQGARTLIANDTRDPMGYFLEAMVAARIGRWDVARNLLYSINGRIDTLPAVQLLRGAVWLQAGAGENAVAALRPLLRDNPRNRPAARLMALALAKVGDNMGVMTTLAPLADEGDRWAVAMTAATAEKMGDRARAARLWDLRPQAASPMPLANSLAAANVRFYRQTALRLLESYAAARDYRSAGMVRDTWRFAYPADLQVLRLAAHDAVSASIPEDAVKIAEAVHARRGDDAALYVDLAWAYGRVGKLQTALTFAEQAYTLAPMDDGAAAAFGWYRIRTGDREDGLALIDKAMAIAPQDQKLRALRASAEKL